LATGAASIKQFKEQVEVEGGLKADTLALYLPQIEQPLSPESATLESFGMPTELYAVIMHRISIAEDITGTAPCELTDAQLASACNTSACHGGDIISLQSCEQLRDIGCLLQLGQMQELDISGCSSIDLRTLIAGVVPHMGLTKITFGHQQAQAAYQGKSLQVALEFSATEADFSRKSLGPSEASILAALLPKCKSLTSLNLQHNGIGELALPDGWTVAEDEDGYEFYLGPNGDEEYVMPLDSKPDGAIALVNAIKNHEGLSIVNLLSNNIRPRQARELIKLMEPKGKLTTLCGFSREEAKLDLDKANLGSGCAMLIANEIEKNGALCCEDGEYFQEWSLNPAYTPGAEAVLMCEGGHCDSHTLKEVEQGIHEKARTGHSCDGNCGVMYPAGVMYGCRICNLDYCAECVSGAVEGHVKHPALAFIKDLRFQNAAPDIDGQDKDPCMPLANGICNRCDQNVLQHHAKGTLSVVNIMGNNIGKYQLLNLQKIMSSNPLLVSLCGIPDDATQADFSSVGMDANEAVVLAAELPSKRSLSDLNLSRNCLGRSTLPEGWIAYCDMSMEGGYESEGVEPKLMYRHEESGKQTHRPGTLEARIVISNVIKDTKLLALNLSSNYLGTAGAKVVAEALTSNVSYWCVRCYSFFEHRLNDCSVIKYAY
jgi:hypothetical protein